MFKHQDNLLVQVQYKFSTSQEKQMFAANNGQYKYQSLKDYLIGKISSGEYQSGFQVASEPELCKKFNLSRNTTRQALQELEKEGYVYRIRGKGTFVKNNTPQQSRKIALLIYDTAYMTYPVTADLIHGIDEVLCQNDYALDILAGKRTLQSEQIGKLTETYAGFLFGAYQIEEAILNELLASSRPGLFVKNYLDRYKDHAALIDFEKAGFLAAEHLINHNCHDLGMVYAGEDINISRDFANGVRKAALEYGCRMKQVNQKICDYTSSLTAGTLAEHFIEAKVDGIVCSADEFALSLLEDLHTRGVKVPEDIKLTGCNNILRSQISQPALTTVEIPTYKLGKLAAENLLAAINGGNLEKLPIIEPELIIRNSSIL